MLDNIQKADTFHTSVATRRNGSYRITCVKS